MNGSERDDTDGSECSACSVFIRNHVPEILERWETLVRTLPTARHLDQPTLIDSMPALLAMIADATDQLARGNTGVRGEELSQAHAVDRLSGGFDLRDVVMELGMLRTCITEAIEAAGVPVPIADLRVFDRAVDQLIAEAVDRYAKARERTLDTLDRIATAALESRGLDDLLQRLLQIMVEASASIDTATIVVRENNRFHVRASVGLEEEVVDQVSLGLEDGFVGRIASSREPQALASAQTDAVIARPALRRAGVRALYGVPLIEDNEVIAVAHIGSLTSTDFPADDKRLFRAVANRATAIIYEHVLRETAQRTTQMLRDREQELRTLADNIPQFAWMADRDGDIYWYNRRWLDYTGTTLDEMRVRGAGDFIDPDYRDRVLEGFRQAIARGKPWDDTMPLRGSNGQHRWFLSRAIPIRDERGQIIRWFGTNTDITEQRFLDDATKLLNSSLDYYETLHEIAYLAVPDLADWCIVDLADEQGAIQRLVIAHQAPTKIELGREWDRKFPTDWNAPGGVPRVIRTGEPEFATEIPDEALVAAASDTQHLEALRALGMRSYIIAPLLARGRTLGAITLLTAESDRRYDADDLALVGELGRRAGMAVDNARLYKDSQQSLRDREEALRLREEVLAVVSHDLRSPLGVIAMSAEFLEDEYPMLRGTKRLELIERSADRMQHMIDDLLEMATIQAGGLTLNRIPEEAERIVAGIVDAYETTAAALGLTLVPQFDLEGVQLLCDRNRIERVFGNLIGNALKYCRRGDMIFLRGRVIDDRVQFSVADTGPGIAAEDREHLFEPYWTARRHGGKPGTGLGLYISKGIIEAHGGELWVESQPGVGTEFFFRLPLAGEARPHRGEAGPSPPTQH